MRKYVRSKPHNKLGPAKIEKMRQWHAAGLSVKAIATGLGISRTHTFRLLKQYLSRR